MAYRLEGNEGVDWELRRSAVEQGGEALEQLTVGLRVDSAKAIHEARKSLKKQRSLMRLGRSILQPGERRRENEALRGVAAALSATRDTDVAVEALDKLAERFCRTGAEDHDGCNQGAPRAAARQRYPPAAGLESQRAGR